MMFKYVDMITSPGVDGILSNGNKDLNDILEKVTFSHEGHSTDLLFIVGHYDCLGNPVDDETHYKQIITSVERIKEAYSNCNVIGLWVDNEFNIQNVFEL